MDRFSTQIDKTSAETGRFPDLNRSTFSTTRVKFADYTRVVCYFYVFKIARKTNKIYLFCVVFTSFLRGFTIVENVICLSVVCYDNASKMQ